MRDPEGRASLLWGLVGGLAFLVLVQGYELLTDIAVSAPVKAGVALVVAASAATLTHFARPRLHGNERA
jgi:putative flippase GtrA